MSTVNGKKPLSQKPVKRLLTDEMVFGDNAGIPPEVRADMEKRQLVPRWLNSKKVYANQGYHLRGWQVYKRPKDIGQPEFKFGTDPDGIVRMGDLILGFKTKEKHIEHKELLSQKSDRQSAAVKAKGTELKAIARSKGMDVEVDDEYGSD